MTRPYFRLLLQPWAIVSIIALGVWGKSADDTITTTRVDHNGVFYFNETVEDLPTDIGSINYGTLINAALFDDIGAYHGFQLLCNADGRLYVRGINGRYYSNWIKITDGV